MGAVDVLIALGYIVTLTLVVALPLVCLVAWMDRR